MTPPKEPKIRFHVEDDGSGQWEIWDMKREEIPARFDQDYFQKSEVERILRRLIRRTNP